MNIFSDDDINKLARLSRLKLTDNEVIKYKAELSAILSYVERLQDVDLEGFEPTSQVTGLVNVLRDDEVQDYGVTPQRLLANAPQIEDGMFKVNRMVG